MVIWPRRETNNLYVIIEVGVIGARKFSSLFIIFGDVVAAAQQRSDTRMNQPANHSLERASTKISLR